jgi:ADP-ribosylglycohydrolase
MHYPEPDEERRKPMKKNAEAMVMASFAADALALGAHWIYDTDQIARTFNNVETFQKPGENSYHPTKQAGDFTHYGDQTMVLLESLAIRQKFDLEHFAGLWRQFHQNYTGYIDHATRTTLVNFNNGSSAESAGSESTDLGGAARIAPILYAYRSSCDEAVHHARTQTAMTHNSPLVIDSAAFFAHVVFRILHGESPVAAIETTTSSAFNREPFQTWVGNGLESRSSGTIESIKRFGQMCQAGSAFPSVIHLVARYQDDLRQALIENVMAGGDSAARGMVAGMLLGAFHGIDAIPEPWLTALTARQTILSYLADIGA